MKLLHYPRNLHNTGYIDCYTTYVQNLVEKNLQIFCKNYKLLV